MAGRINITAHKDVCNIVAACSANQITKDYYFFLCGQINRGTMKKAVCSIYYKQSDYTTYHLISI